MATVEFTCAVCGALAMRIMSTNPDEPLFADGPPPDGRGPAAGADGVRVIAPGLTDMWLAARETRGGGAAVRAAIAAADPARLLRLDQEIVPLYCSQCRTSYCAEHWRRWLVFADDFPGWLEEERGTCPKGHERMLVD